MNKKFDINMNDNKIEQRSQKVVVVMPAYNAELTLEKTFRDIPKASVDEIILIDDASSDRTVEIAKKLGITVVRHSENKGYGANQKSCYDEALKRGADIVVMLHPDYQYDPHVIPCILGFLSTGICDVIIGSRIRTRRETLEGGMPLYKYISNRFLTAIENITLGQNLGDCHSGFRAYTNEVLKTIPYRQNSDDFVFDTELLAQAVFYNFRIGDVPMPTRYFDEASSINFVRSIKYGIQTLWVMAKYLIQKIGLCNFKIFSLPSTKLEKVARDKKIKIIFLDRDGVIDRDPGFGGYVTSWSEFEFLPGALEALKKLNQAGFLVIVISNQAGVAKGLYTLEDLDEITKNMLKEVEKAGARIHAVHYCPHKDEDNCSCRKPKIGLFSQATEGLEVNFGYAFFIGDNRRDMLAGKAIGCKTIFVLSGNTKLEDLDVKPDFIARDLLAAVDKIVLKTEK